KIHADDTPVPVLQPGRGKTKTGRLLELTLAVYAHKQCKTSGTQPDFLGDGRRGR
ncbi:hypothetical protein AVS7_04296, partial [Acidovorax sp. MR-S7]